MQCAWAVNFSWTLRSFEGGQIRGLVNLINLSMRSDQPDPLFLFCSSIASVLNPNQDSPAVETPSSDPVDSAQMGYAQSKWVAEQLCSEASRKGLDVIVYRLGQLCGDTESGIWNETEGWPLLIKSAEPTGCLPQINDVRVAFCMMMCIADQCIEPVLATCRYRCKSNVRSGC